MATGRILIPGCGTGHDVRAIAAACPEAEVIGIDISPTALEQAEAQSNPANAYYQLCDLFDLPADLKGSCDWLVEHTCYCAIDPAMRPAYAGAITQLLRPSIGQLLGIFFIDPYDDEHQSGGGPPHGTELAELESRFVAGLGFTEAQAYTPDVSYPGREGRERLIWYQQQPSES